MAPKEDDLLHQMMNADLMVGEERPAMTVVPTTEASFLPHNSVLSSPVEIPAVPSLPNAEKPLKITVIHCWSAPRSRSTALLYSFEARGADTVCIDEPLQRQWLIHQGDKAQRPYKANMIAGTPMKPEEDPTLWHRETLSLDERITDAVHKLYKTLGSDSNTKEGVIFCKYISKTHFLYDFDNELRSFDGISVDVTHKHMFFVRDPVAIVRSWDDLSGLHNDSCSAADVGIVPLLSIFRAHQQRNSNNDDSLIVVLDSDELIKDPPGVLRRTCEDLKIPYKDSMMSWKAGPHECDCVHGDWWYVNVRKSTGWLTEAGPKKEKKEAKAINPMLLPALHESIPAYEFVVRHSNAVQMQQ